MFQLTTRNGIEKPTQKIFDRIKAGNFRSSEGEAIISSRIWARGNTIRSRSIHSSLTIATRQKQTVSRAPINVIHQNSGVNQTSHGIAWSGGSPSENQVIVSFDGNNHFGRLGWISSAHPFSVRT